MSYIKMTMCENAENMRKTAEEWMKEAEQSGYTLGKYLVLRTEEFSSEGDTYCGTGWSFDDFDEAMERLGSISEEEGSENIFIFNKDYSVYADWTNPGDEAWICDVSDLEMAKRIADDTFQEYASKVWKVTVEISYFSYLADEWIGKLVYTAK